MTIELFRCLFVFFSLSYNAFVSTLLWMRNKPKFKQLYSENHASTQSSFILLLTHGDKTDCEKVQKTFQSYDG